MRTSRSTLIPAVPVVALVIVTAVAPNAIGKSAVNLAVPEHAREQVSAYEEEPVSLEEPPYMPEEIADLVRGALGLSRDEAPQVGAAGEVVFVDDRGTTTVSYQADLDSMSREQWVDNEILNGAEILVRPTGHELAIYRDRQTWVQVAFPLGSSDDSIEGLRILLQAREPMAVTEGESSPEPTAVALSNHVIEQALAIIQRHQG